MTILPGATLPYRYKDETKTKRIKVPTHLDGRRLAHSHAIQGVAFEEIRDWCKHNHGGYEITMLTWTLLVQFVQYQDAIHFRLRWSDKIVKATPDMFESTLWYAPAGLNRGLRAGELGLIRAGKGTGKSILSRSGV